MKGLEIQIVDKSKKLQDRTVLITGNSKSIGRAIALRMAKDGANVILASDVDLSDIAKEVDAAGGNGLAVTMDIRNEAEVKAAIDKGALRFGGIDILINNAGFISATDTEETAMQSFDEANAINVRGTYLVTKTCLPYLKAGRDPHILNISPPINLHRRWFAGRVAYTIAKYGMSMCILGMAQEFKGYGIMVNCLWPRCVIENEIEAKGRSKDVCRKPEIMGDAAYSILIKDPKPTGLFYLDDQALKEDGVTNFDKYCVNPNFVRQLNLLTFVDDSGVVYEKADVTTKTMKLEKHEVGARFKEILEKIESFIDDKLIEKINALYKITVNGTESKVVTLDLRTGAGHFRMGEPTDKEDLHIIMDDNCFYEIFVQGIRFDFAYMNSRFTIVGNDSKIIPLNQLVRVCKAKLKMQNKM